MKKQASIQKQQTMNEQQTTKQSFKKMSPMKAIAASLAVVTLSLSAVTAQARDYDHVRFGVDVPYEPFEYRKPNGELTGFEIDLGNAACKEIGITCEWVVQGWDGIIPGLLARKYDAIMSSMSIKAERREKVLFSEAYYTTPSAWFAASDHNFNVKNKDSMKDARVGVQRGTAQDDYISEVYGDTVKVKRYNTAEDLVLDLKAQRLDLVFLDYPVGEKTLLKEKRFTQASEFIKSPVKYFGEGVGIAFRKRDKALAAKFNKALQTLKDNGTYDEIMRRYFTYDIKL